MFKLVTFILKFYPVVMIVIEIVEAYGTNKGGAEKKALVLKVVRELAGRFGLNLTTAHVAVISQIIDAVVATLNALGIFKKDTEAEPEGSVVVPAPAFNVIDKQLDDIEAMLIR